jgi:lipopolysaccharide transport system ATP-binding protein
MKPIIEVQNLSKQYRLGNVGTGTMAHDFNRWWHRVRGKEDPYLTIGETNDRTTKGESEYVWALRDISFNVMPGEVLGLIGRNGAGKSTLLKILSRITIPSTGSVRLRGRVASLLEVGTGMHGELTGRENIYLNGTILGMRRHEIDRKFDEIIDFAGIERYLDTPVKRYSSGMFIRLGFAVAAFLEPEILIVDEVLAVGDAEFQKKCLGKMRDVSEGEGRTILFVSHNMASVKTLCNKAAVLENGLISFQGITEDAVAHYLTGNKDEKMTEPRIYKFFENEFLILRDVRVKPGGKQFGKAIDETDIIEVKAEIFIKQIPKRLHLTFVLNNEIGEPLFTFSHVTSEISLFENVLHRG